MELTQIFWVKTILVKMVMNKDLNDQIVDISSVDWVSATETRNYSQDEHLLDWLKLFGERNGFKSDEKYPDFDQRTDFSRFVMEKGILFEKAIANYLSCGLDLHEINSDGVQEPFQSLYSQTITAINSGAELIYQPAMIHYPSKTYGFSDFLIRSDKLKELFPENITLEESQIPCSISGDNPWHYRVIDIKFATLNFLSGGDLSASQGSSWAYMHQIYIYNRALGAMQGYRPPGGYLLGRKWRQKIKGVELRSNNSLDRLGFVPDTTTSRSKGPLPESVESACLWLRELRSEGESWNVFPEPTRPELRPNMTSINDQPWHRCKREIDDILKDLTGLWQVGVAKRNDANNIGILRRDQLGYTSGQLGVGGEKQSRKLQQIIDVNSKASKKTILPEKIIQCNQDWRINDDVEFFVDFETVSDLDDDFTKIPESGGTPLIFMIGCGHVESGEWVWSCFTTDSLCEASEAEVIEQWIAYMDDVISRLAATEAKPRVFHWSHAEKSTFETAFNSAVNRHPDKVWNKPYWYDFLKNVIREEPVTVQGAFGFGLKAIATAMKKLSYIETGWDAGPTDGLGAMVGAWTAAREAKAKGIKLTETSLMEEIKKYNEVDCKVMMEIINYLRSEH